MSDQDTPAAGFSSPPVHSRFKKGESGYPKGRPKKQEDIYTLLQRVLRRKLKLKGADRQIQIREALIRMLRELALSGDRRALDLQRRIMEEAGASQTDADDPEKTRKRVLDAFREMGVKVISSGADNAR
jgi:hypothetical protein